MVKGLPYLGNPERKCTVKAHEKAAAGDTGVNSQTMYNLGRGSSVPSIVETRSKRMGTGKHSFAV